MKKLLFFVASLVMVSFVLPGGVISKKERKFAANFLKDSENSLLNSVKGLSESQLKYKPAPDRWSIEECLKHIAGTEQALWQMTYGNLKEPARAEKRAEIKATDDAVIKMIEDRSHKVQTSEQFRPENISYKTAEEAIESFKTNRAKLIEFVKSTNEDLRSHVSTLPIGSFDSYQMILFIGGHTNRHRLQIEEVKADPNFPKS